jgi:DNA invertase Pin-like site-specific DNA recombinase
MLIGYARVSTYEQTLNLQQDALTKAGCTKIFTDTASGAKSERKGLDEALSYVRKGDTLVVWRLDRLGRSLPHLISTMTDLVERGIGFKSLIENIDTTTSGGKLIFHIFGALAEFERNLKKAVNMDHPERDVGVPTTYLKASAGGTGGSWYVLMEPAKGW